MSGKSPHRRLRRYCYKWRCRNRDGDERVHPRLLEVTKDVIWNGVTPDGTLFEICITGPSYPSGDCKSTPAAPEMGRPDSRHLHVTESALGSEWEVPSSTTPAYCYKWRCRNRDGDERVHPRLP
ncbi:hypothetical protein [Methanovulcanius yangii]|uniref:hypothetical protein n=1 Tax=Methanovulcanius yangii TaxID=1789227 RepID=UPI0029CA35C9|nr:hypothetical protein [Methanovulcanius yangii]